MQDLDITNYPLSWPANQPRVEPSKRKNAAFSTRTRGGYLLPYGRERKHSIAESARELEQEIRRMGGREMIISTNLKVKANGMPYSAQRTPDDPGVAVYFKWNKRDLVFACDKWKAIEDNLWAIVKHIEALRGQERWGVGSLDQAFAGYAALPDPDQLQWWQVLEVSPSASVEMIDAAYKTLARKYHPDAEGGSHEMFVKLNEACKLAKASKS
jgi:DnaJ-domain-containing protein 1